MPRGGTENNIAINTTRRTTWRIKFCFIRHVQWLTRTIKTNGSERSDLSMDDVTQLFPQLSVGRRCWWQHLMGGLGPLLCHTFPTYEFWVCHAYCQMTHHYDLLIETPYANLSKGMRQLNGVYTQRFNRTHTRVGHVFQGRFKAILVDKDSQVGWAIHCPRGRAKRRAHRAIDTG